MTTPSNTQVGESGKSGGSTLWGKLTHKARQGAEKVRAPRVGGSTNFLCENSLCRPESSAVSLRESCASGAKVGTFCPRRDAAHQRLIAVWSWLRRRELIGFLSEKRRGASAVSGTKATFESSGITDYRSLRLSKNQLDAERAIHHKETFKQHRQSANASR
jgi:hypothetical protein